MPVDHTTIDHWVQKYAPELDKQTPWYRQVSDWQARSWQVDETYVRVGGKWCCLYRAIITGGQTLDFYLSLKRNVAVAGVAVSGAPGNMSTHDGITTAR